MRSRGVRVERVEAERVRRALAAAGALRADLEVDRGMDWVVFPVDERAVDLPPSGVEVSHDFRVRRSVPPAEYRALIELPGELHRALPRSFDVVGDAVLIRLPAELREHAGAIGEALLEFVPGARVVGLDLGVHGEARVRRLERIAGAGPFRTVHRENGLELEVDLERAYFSPRLAREHAAVAAAVGPAEEVLDLCCGVGPFAVTIAVQRRSARVVAVDSNPGAVELARANVERARVAERVTVVLRTASEYLATAPRFSRVVLNLPHGGRPYLRAAADRLRPGGTLHYYEIVENTAAAGRPAELLGELSDPREFVVADEHLVHEYSPREGLRQYTLNRASAPSA